MCVLYDLVAGKLNNVVVGWLVAYYQVQGTTYGPLVPRRTFGLPRGTLVQGA